jgi:hypothetical protein
LIKYDNIARVRREVENLLLLVDELRDRGIPKELIVNVIIDEHRKAGKENEHSNKDKLS